MVGLSFVGWFKSAGNPILNEWQLTMGYRYHPPLPSGGPGPLAARIGYSNRHSGDEEN